MSSSPARVEDPPVPQVISSPLKEEADDETAPSSESSVDPLMDNEEYIDPDDSLSIVRILWNNALALVALMDFCASWAHQMELTRWEMVGPKESPVPLSDFWATFAVNHATFGLLFSLLWFLDAFITARENRARAIRDIDRRRAMGEKVDVTSKWFKGMTKPTVTYMRSIFIQVALLPVGFYYTAYTVMVAFVKGEDMSEHFSWETPAHLHDQCLAHQHTFHHPKQVDEEDHYETYVNYSIVFAVIRLGMIHLGRMLKKEGERQTKEIAVTVAKRALRHPLHFSRKLKQFLSYLRWAKYLIPIVATSNKFIQNLKDLLKKMRQKREAYFARKLRRALMRKRTPDEIREHAAICMQKVYRAKKARRAARALAILQGNKETIAAMKMQKRFRRWVERARAKLARQKEELAELKKKQEEMKAKTGESLDANDRARMYKLLQELNKQTDFVINKMLLRPNTPFIVWWKAAFVFAVIFEIGGKALEPRMQKHYKSYNNMVEETVCPTRWATLPQCSSEPHHKTKLPGKLKAGIGMLAHIGHHDHPHEHDVEKHVDDAKKHVDEVKRNVEKHVDDVDDVEPKKPNKFKAGLSKLLHIGRRNKNKEDQSGGDAGSGHRGAKEEPHHDHHHRDDHHHHHHHHGRHHGDHGETHDKPWYCSNAATTVQGGFVSFLEFFIRHFDGFMAVVFFLDVFISFFTGEIDDETGYLKPPGFFPRYILPGVLLQCVVNPQMETTAKIIKWCLVEFLTLGPIRVIRWTAALLVPISLFIGHCIQVGYQAYRRRHSVVY